MKSSGLTYFGAFHHPACGWIDGRLIIKDSEQKLRILHFDKKIQGAIQNLKM